MPSKNKSVRQPLKKGVARVPLVMQMETLECGAACLAMVMAWYHKWVPLEIARVDCGVSRNGSNARNMILAARHYGFEAHGYRMELDELRRSATFPCIIHWNFNHFVVLDGFRGGRAVINDPARGVVKIPLDRFDESFTGVVITLAPSADFTPSGKRKSTLAFARGRLLGAGPAVAFVALTTVISYLFQVINPAVSRVFFDRLLTGKSPDWLGPFISLMTLLCAIQLVVEWARTVYSLRINGKLAVIGSTRFMWKVLGLPMEFFSQRMAGDILQRQSTNAGIARTLVETIAPLLLNSAMMVFYLVLMLRQSPLMTLIGLGSICANLMVARYLSARRVNLTQVQMRDADKLASATLAGISMTETIKASGAENGFFRKWAGYQASVNAQSVKYARMNARVGLIPALINTLANYLVLFFGVRLAMEGKFTLGAIALFQGLLSSFTGPAQTLIGAGQTIQEMRTEMERVEDVMQYPSDPNVRFDPIGDDVDCAKLKGGVTLKNVTFGYSRLGRPVISNFSLDILPGQRVAIVGASGCGKSTLSKLISGLYAPWSGEILFDGKPIRQIPRPVFAGSLAVVDQDIILFEDTIAANIRMWDNSIADFEVVLAARDAQLHDDILRRPGGYQGRLTENGQDLSGGQRQRLEIARVLAQDPSIIILDEATSALDAKTEYDVVQAIQNRGITCIVIAHRLSTIRDCDQIIVLDKGKIVERGTHKTLYARGGKYAELVTSE